MNLCDLKRLDSDKKRTSARSKVSAPWPLQLILPRFTIATFIFSDGFEFVPVPLLAQSSFVRAITLKAPPTRRLGDV